MSESPSPPPPPALSEADKQFAWSFAIAGVLALAAWVVFMYGPLIFPRHVRLPPAASVSKFVTIKEYTQSLAFRDETGQVFSLTGVTVEPLDESARARAGARLRELAPPGTVVYIETEPGIGLDRQVAVKAGVYIAPDDYDPAKPFPYERATMLAEVLVREGLVRVDRNGHYMCETELSMSELEAHRHGRGLWAGQESDVVAPAPEGGKARAPEPPSVAARDSPEPKAPKPPPPRTDEFRFQFDDLPCLEAVRRFAESAGKPLKIETGIYGKVTFADPKVYTYAEAFDSLSLLLAVQGYVMVETPEAIRVTAAASGARNAGEPSPPRPPSMAGERVADLSTYRGQPVVVVYNPAQDSYLAYKPGDDLAGGRIVQVDYRPLTLPKNPQAMSKSRAILRIGAEYYAVELGQNLSDKRVLAAAELPADLPK